MKLKHKIGLFNSLISGILLPTVTLAADGEHTLQLVARGVYWKDVSTAYPTTTARSPRPNEYDQTALGMQVNYQSPFWGGVVGVDTSAYGVVKLGESGTPTTNLLEVANNGQLQNSYATLGQALIKLKYQDTAQIKLGRQLQDSLLLKSTYTRAVPDTYSGVSGFIKPIPEVNIYGAMYDQWRSRSTGEFEKFRTEATAAGVPNMIDYVAILGAGYNKGPISVTAEYLNSKNYLSKFGLVGAYTIPLSFSSLKLSSGLHSSKDAGPLFVCSAEKEMDCTGTGRIQNSGRGIYVDAEWAVNGLTLGVAVAKFDGFWIEDNFATNSQKVGSLTQDHGTNPFPTGASLGPDLSNNGETVKSIRFAYDWKSFVSGLKTSFKYSSGSGARSSNLSNNAEGAEHYRELGVFYALPFVKNLAVRYAYFNYDSSVKEGSTSATIKGMPRQDWDQHRFYIDYNYQF